MKAIRFAISMASGATAAIFSHCGLTAMGAERAAVLAGTCLAAFSVAYIVSYALARSQR
jgi:hypothetical protein